jgi:hypothetical protein
VWWVDATALGQQGILFVPEVDTLVFTVVDPLGGRHRTGVLGIALSMARRIAVDTGEAWIVASDGTTVHLTLTDVESAFSRPWISTVIHACKEQP